MAENQRIMEYGGSGSPDVPIKAFRVAVSALYEADFAAWLAEQADLARRGSVNALDLANIAEELEGMGRAERHAVASQLCRLLAHMLKWRHQPALRSKGWRRSIRDARTRIERRLRSSPSIRADLPRLVDAEYPGAVRWAADETGLERGAFPADCPWSLGELLDPDFLP